MRRRTTFRAVNSTSLFYREIHNPLSMFSSTYNNNVNNIIQNIQYQRRLYSSCTSTLIHPTTVLHWGKNRMTPTTFHMNNSDLDVQELTETNLGGDVDKYTLNDVEEMKSEDLELRVEQMKGMYNPAVYAFCFYPSPDIIHLILDLSLLPSYRSEVSVAQWFADPKLMLRQPRILPDLLGPERWSKLKDPLMVLIKELDQISPFAKVLKKYRLPSQLWIPLMRQFAVEVLVSTDKTLLASIVLSFCNGKLDNKYGLPNDSVQRTIVVSELMLGTACEAGVTKIATTASHVLRLNQIPNTYHIQKMLMLSLSAGARRDLDWEARTNGSLALAIGEWKTKYYPIVEADLEAAASGAQLRNDVTIDNYEEVDDNNNNNNDGKVDSNSNSTTTDDDGLISSDEDTMASSGMPVTTDDEDDLPIVDGMDDDNIDEEHTASLAEGEEEEEESENESGTFEDPYARESVSRVSNYFTGAGDRSVENGGRGNSNNNSNNKGKIAGDILAAKKQRQRDIKGEREMLRSVSRGLGRRKEAVKTNVVLISKGMKSKKSNRVD